MNREIKCRGWDKDTERWYYGSYVRLERTTPYPMSPFPVADAKKFEDEQVDHYIFFTEMNDWGLETKKLRATVDPKSVGQYAGLLDKKRVAIWEGDILEHSYKAIGKTEPHVRRFKVVFSDGAFQQYEPGDGEDAFDIWYDWNEIVVIGNIYESPELLEAA